MVCPVHLGRAIAAVGSQHADETLNLWSSLPTSGEKVCPATNNFGGVVLSFVIAHRQSNGSDLISEPHAVKVLARLLIRPVSKYSPIRLATPQLDNTMQKIEGFIGMTA